MARDAIIFCENGEFTKRDPCDHDVTGESFDKDELIGECCCPVCNSTNIKYEDTCFDVPETVYLDYKCRNCDSEFSMRYEFTGACVFKDGRCDDEAEGVHE